MSLRSRLIGAFLIVLLLVGSLGVLSVLGNRDIERQTVQASESSFLEARAASQMALALERADEVARAMLLERYRRQQTEAGGSPPPEPTVSGVFRDREAEFRAALESFDIALARAREATRVGTDLAAAAGDDRQLQRERQEIQELLDPATEGFARLKAQAADFLRRIEADPRDAERYLDDVLEPHLQGALLPLLEEYSQRAHEEVQEEMQIIRDEIRRTNRITTGLSLGALIVLLVMGVALYRSVARPVAQLTEAAERIGAGELRGLVELETAGELGVLARTFNRMTRQLSETMMSKGHLDNVLDSMAGALFLVGADHKIERVNQAALQLLGHERNELLGRPFDTICPAEESDSVALMLRLAVEGYLRSVERSLLKKDGSPMPVSFSGSALSDSSGEIVGFVCVAHDLSRQKQIEQTIRDSLKRKETLLREVHHRVKNNLQVISSLLELQSSYFDEERVLEMFAESQSRIRAMALIHEQLHRAPDLEEIDIRDYIETLAHQLFESRGIRADEIALRFRLEEHLLDSDQAVALGLIVNELVANALKHGFSDGSAGEVCVSFRSADGATLNLSVADNGKGLAKDFKLKETESLGLNLVAALVKQLQGTLHLTSNGGTEFRVEFPARRFRKQAAQDAANVV